MSANANPAAALEGIWLDANRYYDAERRQNEMSLAYLVAQACKKANPGTPPPEASDLNGKSQSLLASEIAYARQKIQNFLKSGDAGMELPRGSFLNRLENFEKKQGELTEVINKLSSSFDNILSRLESVEKSLDLVIKDKAVTKKENKKSNIQNGASNPANEDDDLDLFGSDEEDASTAKLREERLQAYANKKAKKPALVAKSSVVLDVKPWDDETDMKAMEKTVREIQTDGLKWGASKLVPLAYGINKLQIVAIVEDEKVSIDWLQETISEIEDLVQSVDIAAFNKL